MPTLTKCSDKHFSHVQLLPQIYAIDYIRVLFVALLHTKFIPIFINMFYGFKKCFGIAILFFFIKMSTINTFTYLIIIAGDKRRIMRLHKLEIII